MRSVHAQGSRAALFLTHGKFTSMTALFGNSVRMRGMCVLLSRAASTALRVIVPLCLRLMSDEP